MLLVVLLVIRPLLRLLQRDPGADSDADGEAAPRLRGLAPPSLASEAAGEDQALLGKQVELAQRMVDEKPEEAIVALRRMLKPVAGA